jgi:tetratricopeptide (TPR) repeat protein
VGVSDAENLGREALGRFTAFATIFGGLSPDAVRAYAEPSLEVTKCPPSTIIDKLLPLPWWDRSGSRLRPVEPDILGALLSEAVLEVRPDMAPAWLFIGLKFSEASSLPGHIGRIIHDIEHVTHGQSQMPTWLEAGLKSNSAGAHLLRFLVKRFDIPPRLEGVAAAAGAILCNNERDVAELGVLLNATAVHLDRVGRADEALGYAERSVQILDRLYRTEGPQHVPKYLSALNNLANRYDRSGRKREALDLSKQAAGYFEAIAASHPELRSSVEFNLDRVGCMNCLAMGYSNLSQDKPAHEVAERALIVLESLGASGEKFEQKLAFTKHNLALFKSLLGDYSGAVVVMKRAVEIRRRLAEQNPAQYEQDLANSLLQFGDVHRRGGQLSFAIEFYDHAIVIFERLVATNAIRYVQKLTDALGNKEGALRELGSICESEKVRRSLEEVRHRFPT